MTSLSYLFLSSGPLAFDILKLLIALYWIFVVRSKLLALNYFPTYLWCPFIKLVATFPSLSCNRTLMLLIATKSELREQSFFGVNHPVSLHVIFVPEGPVSRPLDKCNAAFRKETFRICTAETVVIKGRL